MNKTQKEHNRRGAATAPLMIGIMIFVALVLGGGTLIYGANHGWFGSGQSLIGGSAVQAPPNINSQCSQNPAYTYGAVDKFAKGTAVVGTDEIKIGSSAPVTSLAAPQAGAGIAYWKNNATWYCPVKTDNVACGPVLMQEECITNGSVTLSVYDLDNRVTLTAGGGANNASMSANAVRNFELDFQGTAKAAQLPFGGCLVVDANTNVTDVAMTGYGITAGCSDLPLTYSIGATTNNYKLFRIPAGFDSDGAGDLKRISMQLKSGGSDPTLSTTTIKFYPANYYIGNNDGQFYLGVERDKNADTTKTATAQSTTFILT